MARRPARPPTARLMLAGVVGINVLVFGTLAVAGVPLLAHASDGSKAGTSAVELIPLAATTQLPADTVVHDVLSGSLAGARPVDAIWASSGTAIDRACPAHGGAVPVVSASRSFKAGGRTVSVRVAAYGAGQGALAMAQLEQRLGACSGARTYGAAVGPTSNAMIAWSQTTVSDATMLVWRRSDVVASVTVPGSSEFGLAQTAASVDQRLTSALRGTCASGTEKVSDAGRSVWSGQTYTGHLVPQTLSLSYPTPSDSPTADLPKGVPSVSVPAPTLFVPSIQALPTEVPLPTVSSPTPVVVTPPGKSQLPVPVTAAPLPPVAPSSPAATATVKQQLADPIGPGCGWAFTMQGPAPFDATAAAQAFAAATAGAQAQLQSQDATWQQEYAAYATSYAGYIAQAQAFVTYATNENAYVATVRGLLYRQLLTVYRQAVAARQAFLDERATAQSAYDAAVSACAAAGSPTATPTVTSTPTAPAPPTTTASPSPSTSSGDTCPPPVPAILDEPVPTVPPSPTPPA